MAYIKLRLTLSNGQGEIAYMSIPEYAFDQDSMSDDKIKEEVLAWQTYKDTVRLFQEEISFNYTPYWDDSRSIEVRTHSKLKLYNFNQISRVEVQAVHYQSAAISLANPLKPSDRKWMQEKPIKMDTTFSYSCDFQIFQFESNSIIDDFIKQFKKKARATDDFEPQQELFEMMRKLKGRKIVIVSVCTC